MTLMEITLFLLRYLYDVIVMTLYLKKTDAVTMHRMTIRMAKTATNRMAIFETVASAGTINAI